ncbi:MAG TPA: hypothetical protein VF069_12225 [Streptosporangiaceae bacterium]
MSPARGDALPPPSIWEVRAYDRRSAEGWAHLARQAPGNLRRAWFAITDDPRGTSEPARQHRLKGRLSTVLVKGASLEQWQYEVTSGGRIWYAIDDAAATLWVTLAGTGHPRQTDRRR